MNILKQHSFRFSTSPSENAKSSTRFIILVPSKRIEYYSASACEEAHLYSMQIERRLLLFITHVTIISNEYLGQAQGVESWPLYATASLRI